MKGYALSQIIRRKTFSKVFSFLATIFIALVLTSSYFIHTQVSKNHENQAKNIHSKLNQQINTVKLQVENLANNDLIINSIIDDTNRKTYLPIFFDH